MKKLLEENETLVQIVNNNGRPPTSPGFTNLYAEIFCKKNDEKL